MPLFQTGTFKLHSGATSSFKIDCDALTTADWEGLAHIASKMLPSFYGVVGIPRGGIEFAVALNKYADPKANALLIADDVCTTGGSLEQCKSKYSQPTIGVVAFARGRVPSWVTPIFTMPDY